MSALRVLVAPDKFRGSMTASQAAAAIAAGVRIARPDADVDMRPIADGGEGTVEALLVTGWQSRDVRIAGPTGEPVQATIARAVGGAQAVVELADCCGLSRLPGHLPAPMDATTRGVGEALLIALRDGADEIIIAVGGSASTDGGIGFLAALGVRVRDADGVELPAVPASLERAATIDVSGVDAALSGARIRFAADVTNPLTGPQGAAAVFAPQKGATPDQVTVLARGLERWAQTLAAHAGHPVDTTPGAGAAGGIVAGALGALGSICDVRVVSGADLVLGATGVTGAARDADLVIVGEGSLDEQSVAGKAPLALARIAAAAGRQVLAIAGCVRLDPAALRQHGITAWESLTDTASPTEDAMRDAPGLAQRAAAHGVTTLFATERQGGGM
jgi:glycerate kinase